jgi:hypothetical protein
MLGLRLEKELEQRLDRFASKTRRTRSSVARDAVREYLDRHSLDDEFLRQVGVLKGDAVDQDVAGLQASTDLWLHRLDDDDGGYDWGERGPPQ